jgi:hypothetical protein
VLVQSRFCSSGAPGRRGSACPVRRYRVLVANGCSEIVIDTRAVIWPRDPPERQEAISPIAMRVLPSRDRDGEPRDPVDVKAQAAGTEAHAAETPP